jgi:hypothetical protein
MSEALGWFSVICSIVLVLAALFAVSALGAIAKSTARIAEELLSIGETLEALHFLQARRGSEAGELGPETSKPAPGGEKQRKEG